MMHGTYNVKLLGAVIKNIIKTQNQMDLDFIPQSLVLVN